MTSRGAGAAGSSSSEASYSPTLARMASPFRTCRRVLSMSAVCCAYVLTVVALFVTPTHTDLGSALQFCNETRCATLQARVRAHPHKLQAGWQLRAAQQVQHERVALCDQLCATRRRRVHVRR